MKGILIVCCLLVISFSLSFAAKPQIDDGVYVLTQKNFDEFVNGEEFTVVEFYAPWCGHCKNLAPEYAAAAKELAKDDPPVKIAKVDATVESELGSRFGIKGYPTLKIFRFGKQSEYDGPRDSAGIVKYIRSKSGPAYKALETLEAFEKFVGRNSNSYDETRPAVVFFGSSSSAHFPAFKDLTNAYREDVRFGVVENEEVLKKEGQKEGTVGVYQVSRFASKLETPSSFAFALSKPDLFSFFSKNILPLGGEITNENAKLYQEKGVPVLKVYSNLDSQRDPKGAVYQLNRLRKIAKEFDGKLSFAIASKKGNPAEIRDLDLSAVETPFIIHDLKTNLKYRLDSPAYTPESAKKFAEDFVAGKVEVYIKSEPIPESNDEPVKVVVGKTFQKIVEDPTKDVLIEAYAPWCGHCKSLEPKYKELAERLSKFPSITIAKIDATANTLPPAYEVRGFPTIFFVPANKKGQPIKYEGAREVEDFVAFIKREASLPLVSSTGDKE